MENSKFSGRNSLNHPWIFNKYERNNDSTIIHYYFYIKSVIRMLFTLYYCVILLFLMTFI